MAVGKVQSAQQELCLLLVLGQLILLLRGEQAHDRRKVVFLVEVEKDLAIVRVLDDDRLRIVLRRLHRLQRTQQQQAQYGRNNPASEQ